MKNWNAFSALKSALPMQLLDWPHVTFRAILYNEKYIEYEITNCVNIYHGFMV